MYRNSYQRGLLTVFFSVGSKPLAIWDIHTQDGYVTRFLDQDIKSMVLEIGGTNVSTTYITCPKDNKVLGITMPFLVMIVKNLRKYFSFEVTILDETGTRRRFRVSNFQSSTQILPLCTVMPIGLSEGWNQIQFNLAEFTRRAYNKQYVEVQKLKINANIRLRRIYFTERLMPEDELPAEYKLFFPISSKSVKEPKDFEAQKPTASSKENIKPSNSLQSIKHQLAQSSGIISSKADIVRTKSKSSVTSLKKQPSQISRKISKSEVETIKEPIENISEKLEVRDDKVGEEKSVTDDTVQEEVNEDKATSASSLSEEFKDEVTEVTAEATKVMAKESIIITEGTEVKELLQISQ